MVRSSRQLLVAVHDVTPAHAKRLDRVFRLLTEFGVERYALLVVPNWHGTSPLEKHPEFAAGLRARQDQGAEIFLHGLRHDEHGAQRTLWQNVRTWGRTDREAEFLVLSEREAGKRLDRGLETLRACGLEPVGFVPPAWFHGRRSFELIHERGLDLTEDSLSVFSLAQGRGLSAPATEWSTRKAWRAAAGVAIAAVRRPLESWRPLLRLVIHPTDMDVPSVVGSVRNTLERLLASRRAVTYGEALAPR